MTCRPFREDRTAFSRKSLKTFEEMKEELLHLAKVNKISFLNGRNIHLPAKKSKKTCALLAFFNNPMIKNVRMSSQESLDNFIYNDFKFELSKYFLDELYVLFSHYGIHLLKKTVKMKITFMQKHNNGSAFVITITSVLSSPAKRKDLLTMQTTQAIDKDLVSLFSKFNLTYFREMFNCTVEDLDFHLALSCFLHIENPPNEMS